MGTNGVQAVDAGRLLFDGSAASELTPNDAPKPAVTAAAPFLFRHYGLTRALVAPIVRVLYRLRLHGQDHIPAGPSVIVPNHVSYMDPLLIAYASKRPMRFLMYRPIYETWGLKWLFKSLGAIPVSGKDSKALIDASLDEARRALAAGQTVVIFPEGRLSTTGHMAMFRRGFEKIAAEAGAPVIPAHVDGLWGSLFSRRKGLTLAARLRAIPRRLSVRFGSALAKADAQSARQAVEELSAEAMTERIERSKKPLFRQFLGRAKRYWSRRAIADSSGQDLTYGKALAGAALMGAALEGQLGPAKNVGVLLPPTAAGALANLALSANGRVPINLNYTASKDAVAHAVSSTGMETIVTSRKFLAALQERGASLPAAKLILLEDIAPTIPAWKKTVTYLLMRILPRFAVEAIFFRAAPKSLDDTATVLFTSGSSALPKGVVLTQKNLLANVEMVLDLVPRTPTDAVLGVLPFFHSFGYTMTLWMPLLSGMAAAYHTHPMEAEAIGKLAAKIKPSILLATPAFLERYARKIPKDSFSSLRLVIAGAERLKPETAALFAAKFGVKPYEGYGATELSPVAAVGVPDAADQRGSKAGSVGVALPGSAAKVVDPDTGAPLGTSKTGMLLIKGPHVMRGYLGDAKKTAEAVQDGWYVTGDLASIDAHGFITIEGRLSRFSKLAGEMVSHTAVEEAVVKAAAAEGASFFVTGVPDAARGERLVVLHAGFPGAPEEVLAKMRAAGVPNLWLPGKADFFTVESIPLLGTGKLDLKTANELARRLSGGQ